MSKREGWTLFLDRDGVINKRLPEDYVKRWAEFEFLPGVLKALDILAGIYGRIIIVTNQQGIGKGLMSENDLAGIHEKMQAIITENGGRIDDVIHCPDLASQPNNCRKPSPQMAYEAKRRFPSIDFQRAVMVGDSESDMAFAENAGMDAVYIGNTDRYKKLEYRPNKRYESLLAFANAQLQLSS